MISFYNSGDKDILYYQNAGSYTTYTVLNFI